MWSRTVHGPSDPTPTAPKLKIENWQAVQNMRWSQSGAHLAVRIKDRERRKTKSRGGLFVCVCVCVCVCVPGFVCWYYKTRIHGKGRPPAATNKQGYSQNAGLWWVVLLGPHGRRQQHQEAGRARGPSQGIADRASDLSYIQTRPGPRRIGPRVRGSAGCSCGSLRGDGIARHHISSEAPQAPGLPYLLNSGMVRQKGRVTGSHGWPGCSSRGRQSN